MSVQQTTLSAGSSGDAVRALQTKLLQLGATIPAAERATATYGPATVQAVANVQAQHKLQTSGNVDEATSVAIDATIPSIVYSVDGTVASGDSAGVGGLSVQVVDKNIPTDVAVAGAVTDDRGRWSATFDGSVLTSRNKLKPDLQANVFNGRTKLASSSVAYDAGVSTTLDVLLPAGSVALASEHETLTNALAAHYVGKLADLQETNGRADITYLANKTGWDARAVAMAALADQLSEQMPPSTSANGSAAGTPAQPIPAAFHYALLRAGIPADPPTLFSTDVNTVQRVWEQGIQSGVIEPALSAQVAPALQTFQQLSSAHALNTSALAGASTLSDLLQISLGSNQQAQAQFADLYTRFRGSVDFWAEVERTFGTSTAQQLKLDGQLARLTLNNASLVGQIKTATAKTPLTSALDLVTNGFHDAAAWSPLITTVPPQIPGNTDTDKKLNYANVLAAQVRISFPTAVVAQRVKTGDIPLATDQATSAGVHDFLMQHQADFVIGIQPFEQYLMKNKLDGSIAAPVKDQIKLLQRVYQITPDDKTMGLLVKSNIGSAYQVAQYGQDEFVRAFGDSLGGTRVAESIYHKATQVHNATLNVAMNYVTARQLPALGNGNGATIMNPGPNPPADNTSDVVAYPTLETLFGSMDYCTCQDCRSILSPAAYLVDLLTFIDCQHPELQNPQSVLFSRRPDLPCLPLTCENTNTPVPYIDLVNEILEYFVTNNLSLTNYTGHDTGSAATPAELLATPQYVTDSAYDVLEGASFPPPLPFHRNLETLRRDFTTNGVALAAAMEALRVDDSLERANATSYAWRDILLERLGLSRQEYALLSDHTKTLQTLYGFAPATPDPTVLTSLAPVKAFASRLGITFDDVVAVLNTRFVNPNVVLLPKLEALDLPFSTLAALKNGTITDAAFDALLPPGIDQSQYGGDVKTWVKNSTNYANLTALITIANPTNETDLCNYDALEFRYSEPDNAKNSLKPIEFYKLSRFIRLWKKLGWTVAQTDAALTALYPAASLPTTGVLATDLQNLETGFGVFLPRLGVVVGLIAPLNLSVDADLLSLLACFAPMGTDGPDSLYRSLFLRPSVLAVDPAFADDGYGNILTDATKKLLDHTETLRSACKLTADEFAAIVADRTWDANTPLSLATVSQLYRHGWLARKLRLSVPEFLAIKELTGWGPFASIDPPNPDVVRFVAFVQALRTAGLRPAQAAYLIWNRDLTGTSVPTDALVTGFARTLRGDYAAVESDFALVDDPKGEIAHARMALVYGGDATDFFFGLINATLVTSAPYASPTTVLDPTIIAVASALGYDDFRKQLTFAGMMTTTVRDALLGLAAATPAFKTAVTQLYANVQTATGPFFDRYPELLAVATSTDPPATKRANLLAQILPALKALRKQEQALAAVAATTGTDASFAQALLTNAPVMHAAAGAAYSALTDLTAVEAGGPSVQFFWADNPSGLTPSATNDAAPLLDYAAGGANPLPPNPAAGHAISAVFAGYLDVPQTGLYNIAIDADAGATVTLTLSGGAVPMAVAPGGTTWTNQSAITLTAGSLAAFTLTVAKTTQTLRVRWESTGNGWDVIPAKYLYSATLVDRFSRTFVRYLKATSLASALQLTANELAHLAVDPDLAIGGAGWLNALQQTGVPAAATAKALREDLIVLLDYARIKAALSPGDERFLAVVMNPAATLPDNSSALLALTGWNAASLAALLAHFGKVQNDLVHVETFRRVFDAYALVTAFGISAAALIAAAFNDPVAGAVTALRTALRARYAEADWLNVVKPVNDTLRELRRDALVAYVLQQFSLSAATSAIDTPDKLYEYFLVDTQMASCMETSRIVLALSTVQLFVERCLMNIESTVASSSIAASQWEWMKRYRVWQANREVFLWPENWLEPELRDDQSPFFKAALSQLLQSDITEDTAAVALLDYLAKLGEVAKLEPCGIWYVEPQAGTAGDVAHVVARTSGAHRKHYYRQRAYGSWTPWEEIKLDIEDNPVVPVVWNDRLLLFWLKLTKSGPLDPTRLPTTATTGTKTINDMTLGDVKSDAKDSASNNLSVSVSAILCYSEYYNGKWQTVHTSDPNAPAAFGSYPPMGQYAFDRTQVTLGAYPVGDVLIVEINGQSWTQFALYNTHSAPVVQTSPTSVPGVQKYRYIPSAGTDLLIWYDKAQYGAYGWYWGDQSTELSRDVITDPLPFTTIYPIQTLQNAWDAPFFLVDSRYAFYVRTADSIVQIPNWSGYGVVQASPSAAASIPPLVIEAVPNFNPIPDPIGPVAVNQNPAIVDPSPVSQFFNGSETIRTALPTAGTVNFGTVAIHAGGSIQNAIVGTEQFVADVKGA